MRMVGRNDQRLGSRDSVESPLVESDGDPQSIEDAIAERVGRPPACVVVERQQPTEARQPGEQGPRDVCRAAAGAGGEVERDGVDRHVVSLMPGGGRSYVSAARRLGGSESRWYSEVTRRCNLPPLPLVTTGFPSPRAANRRAPA